MWDDELARVAQKWSDQCADVDYKGDFKRQDPTLFHDPHPQRKVGQYFKILTPIRTDYFNGKIFLHSWGRAAIQGRQGELEFHTSSLCIRSKRRTA